MKKDKTRNIKRILTLLITEYKFINRLVYRGSNQFKTNIRHRKLIELRNKIILFLSLNEIRKDLKKYKIEDFNDFKVINSSKILNSEVTRIVELTETIYMYSSSECIQGSFIPINLLTMVIVSRIRYLVLAYKKYKSS